MDWAAVASILGERSERPLVLLDHEGRICLFNRVMEQVLGWRRFEVDGRPWALACTPSEDREEAEHWIGDALRGALWSFETRGLAKNGAHILFGFEFALVGKGAEQGLLMTATHWRPAEPAKSPDGELDYQVRCGPSDFGTLVRLQINGERVALKELSRCFEVLHGTASACEECPVLREDGGWPRISVRHSGQHDGAGAFEIRSAERVDANVVHIRARTVSERTLEAIHAAKLQQLADRASLSAREREVLTYLMLGRTIEEMASLIGIAVRTVKFHQANVLQKLGADSRTDLVRMLY
jgi:PAS domain S-box-containing protein